MKSTFLFVLLHGLTIFLGWLLTDSFNPREWESLSKVFYGFLGVLSIFGYICLLTMEIVLEKDLKEVFK